MSLPCRPLRAGMLAAALVALACAPAAAQGFRERNPTARCSDGTFYYGRPVRGEACAGHGRVTEWMVRPRSAARTTRKPSGKRASAARRRPATAVARCRDGKRVAVRSRRHACAGHGGVARWLRR